LTYPQQVPHAVEVAEELAKFIGTLSGPGNTQIQITLVAHSLGCRVALEVLARLAQSNHARVSVAAVFLMAAAVPSGFVEEERCLDGGLSLAGKTYTLFSSQDEALGFVFRAGQGLADWGTEGRGTEAIGLRGRPAYRWSHAIRTLNRHSGYFSDPMTAAKLAEALGLVSPRRLVSCHLPSGQTNSRSGPTRMRFLGRKIGARSIP
jgi:pimeloyl-ACP methyl ester carboxylesterase